MKLVRGQIQAQHTVWGRSRCVSASIYYYRETRTTFYTRSSSSTFKTLLWSQPRCNRLAECSNNKDFGLLHHTISTTTSIAPHRHHHLTIIIIINFEVGAVVVVVVEDDRNIIRLHTASCLFHRIHYHNFPAFPHLRSIFGSGASSSPTSPTDGQPAKWTAFRRRCCGCKHRAERKAIVKRNHQSPSKSITTRKVFSLTDLGQCTILAACHIHLLYNYIYHRVLHNFK